MIEKSVSEINWMTLTKRAFYPSPTAWEDETLYYLLVDRFSDGNEIGYLDNDGNEAKIGKTPLFTEEDIGNATQTEDDKRFWRDAGNRFVGGTLKGLESKLGYLKRLGITTIWLSPVFKQRVSEQTYHGFGIQNFLDVDPRFGTRQDLKNLVETAHKQGVRVILDIILHHSGDVFEYDELTPQWDEGKEYAVKGFRDRDGNPTIPFEPIDLQKEPSLWPDAAIWPKELQTQSTFAQKGSIVNWDSPDESLYGDFLNLKTFYLGSGTLEHFTPSQALVTLCQIYKFWIAFADIDGYRIDSVKHLPEGATRFFTSVIHEFAQSIGKENFYIIGQMTGGRIQTFDALEKTGIDVAQGFENIADKLEYLVKGYRNPEHYFSLFRNSLLVRQESHVWFRNKALIAFDDHDQARKGDSKARFCYDEVSNQENARVLLNALALITTTLGIPCIYYGTEQLFNGHGKSDSFIRESMFGGPFGAFESRGRHFFNESTGIYKELSKILKIRKNYSPLRRGRQYLRPISGDGENFGIPHIIGNEIRSIVPWSRIFANSEILLAINTDYYEPKTAWVTIANDLHQEGDELTCLYSSEERQQNQKVVVEARNGKSVLLTVPAAGFVIYG